MCGLFGVILEKPVVKPRHRIKLFRLFNQLAEENVMRGWDSTGMAGIYTDGLPRIYKDVVPSHEIIQTPGWCTFLDSIITPGLKALVGHTRFGTHGTNIKENAHPFYMPDQGFGPIVGTHNGTIGNHDTLVKGVSSPFANDSANLFWALSGQADEAFPSTLETVDGSFALVFHRKTKLYITRNRWSPLYLARLRDFPGFVYASDRVMLRAAAITAEVSVDYPALLNPNILYGINLVTMQDEHAAYADYKPPAKPADYGWRNKLSKKERKQLKKAQKNRSVPTCDIGFHVP